MQRASQDQQLYGFGTSSSWRTAAWLAKSVRSWRPASAVHSPRRRAAAAVHRAVRSERDEGSVNEPERANARRDELIKQHFPAPAYKLRVSTHAYALYCSAAIRGGADSESPLPPSRPAHGPLLYQLLLPADSAIRSPRAARRVVRVVAYCRLLVGSLRL